MNYSTRFCIPIRRVSEQETSWLRQKLREMQARTFEYEFELPTVWLYGEEGLDDQFLAFLQAFFREMRPSEYLFIDYACIADRSTKDAYGGGTVFVSAQMVSWSDVDLWKRSCVDELVGQVEGSVKVATEI